MEGDIDICDIMAEGENNEIGQMLGLFGLPSKCPVAPVSNKNPYTFISLVHTMCFLR